MKILKCLFESSAHANHLSIPENRYRRLLPLGMWRIENGIIPVKPLIEAAIRLGWLFGGNPVQLLCNKMLWIPELHGAPVRDSGKSGADWGTQVSRKHGLPHNQDAECGVRMALQDLFGCGGPPQTRGSSRGKKEKQDGSVCGIVEGGLEY